MGKPLSAAHKKAISDALKKKGRSSKAGLGTTTNREKKASMTRKKAISARKTPAKKASSGNPKWVDSYNAGRTPAPKHLSGAKKKAWESPKMSNAQAAKSKNPIIAAAAKKVMGQKPPKGRRR